MLRFALAFMIVSMGMVYAEEEMGEVRWLCVNEEQFDEMQADNMDLDEEMFAANDCGDPNCECGCRQGNACTCQ